MEAVYFDTPADFRIWFNKHHKETSELLVGFYKVKSGKRSMSWTESVDEALCFGWIDGVRKSIDAQSYSIRFTPRRSSSIWSNVNIKKVENLTKKGAMTADGIAAFERRSTEKSGIYAFENDAMTLDIAYKKLFKTNESAYSFFESLAPSYQKLAIYRVMSAKQEKTRLARLEKLISECAAEKRP